MLLSQAFYSKRRKDPLGLGRCFSKKLLEHFNWNIYNFNLNKGLDANSYKLISGYLNTKNSELSYNYSDGLLLKEDENKKSITMNNRFKTIFQFINNYNINNSNDTGIIYDTKVVNYNNLDKDIRDIMLKFI